MSVVVLPGNRVEHDGKPYEAGEVIADLSDKEAQSLLAAGVVRSEGGQPSQDQINEDMKAAEGGADLNVQ